MRILSQTFDEIEFLLAPFSLMYDSNFVIYFGMIQIGQSVLEMHRKKSFTISRFYFALNTKYLKRLFWHKDLTW